MSAVDTKFYEKKQKRILFLSLGFLVFVVCITAALFFYEKSVLGELEELEVNINQVEDSIKEIESNEQVQLYRMYQSNKVFFETLEYRSEIPLFATHLQKHLAKHWLQGKDFDFRDGELAMEVSAQTNDSWYAYQKIVTFMREYNQDEKALFTPSQINEFSGYDRVNYDATFILK